MSIYDYGDPFVEWNEANDANDDGEAIIEAERQAEDPGDTAPSYKPRGYRDSEQGYLDAEKEADLMAGDTGLPMGIVRDYDHPGWLILMSLAEAEDYIAEHDDDPDGARVLYRAHAPWAAAEALGETAGPWD